jgi:16S rRNA (guanine966-N2)-methyltransferase
VRIIAGEWRGRAIAAPDGRATRPTSDRVREALFDVLAARLGPSLGSARVLDLFAGSGALGLEALSRGACHAVFVESGRDALRILNANVEALGAGDRATVIAGDAMGAAVPRAVSAGPFTLLLLDPPYRIDRAEVAQLLDRMAASHALVPGALATVEHASAAGAPEPASLEWVRTYRYGETAISLYRTPEGKALT